MRPTSVKRTSMFSLPLPPPKRIQVRGSNTAPKYYNATHKERAAHRVGRGSAYETANQTATNRAGDDGEPYWLQGTAQTSSPCLPWQQEQYAQGFAQGCAAHAASHHTAPPSSHGRTALSSSPSALITATSCTVLRSCTAPQQPEGIQSAVDSYPLAARCVSLSAAPPGSRQQLTRGETRSTSIAAIDALKQVWQLLHHA